MEFEKLQNIIAEVLNVEADEITLNTTFVDDLGADSLDIFRLSWESRRRLISKFRLRRQKDCICGRCSRADQERTELIQCLLKSYREVCQAKGLGGLPKGRIATAPFQKERMFDSGSQTQIAMIAGISQQQDRLEREKYMEYTLNKLEKRIGYSFQDKKLLEHAMIHSSYANEHHLGKLGCNERLEFLGDAVLEVVSSDFLFRTFPEMPEGDMTKTRASLVCEPTLAFCAQEIDLGGFLLLGKGEDATGGRGRDSVVSDAMEALIGAIYLDGGFANAKSLFIDLFSTIWNTKSSFYDSKTILQEIVQGHTDETLTYVLLKEEGRITTRASKCPRCWTVRRIIARHRTDEKISGTACGVPWDLTIRKPQGRYVFKEY